MPFQRLHQIVPWTLSIRVTCEKVIFEWCSLWYTGLGALLWNVVVHTARLQAPLVRTFARTLRKFCAGALYVSLCVNRRPNLKCRRGCDVLRGNRYYADTSCFVRTSVASSGIDTNSITGLWWEACSERFTRYVHRYSDTPLAYIYIFFLLRKTVRDSRGQIRQCVSL